MATTSLADFKGKYNVIIVGPVVAVENQPEVLPTLQATSAAAHYIDDSIQYVSALDTLTEGPQNAEGVADSKEFLASHLGSLGPSQSVLPFASKALKKSVDEWTKPVEERGKQTVILIHINNNCYEEGIENIVSWASSLDAANVDVKDVIIGFYIAEGVNEATKGLFLKLSTDSASFNVKDRFNTQIGQPADAEQGAKYLVAVLNDED